MPALGIAENDCGGSAQIAKIQALNPFDDNMFKRLHEPVNACTRPLDRVISSVEDDTVVSEYCRLSSMV